MRLDLGPEARGERVELFVLEPDHVTADYVGWLNDPVTGRFLESRYAAHTDASTRQFVEQALGSSSTLFLGIRSLALGGHVGNIKLGPISTQHGTGEIGILIGDRRTWGKGIASDAIATLAVIARDRLALRKLTAGCYASNVGSRRAFEKAGFAVEATRSAQVILDGAPEDVLLMARFL